jgi:hypothetical protein
MTRLILDASALTILPKLTEAVELLDESGKTLGQFHPTKRAEGSQPSFKSPHTREELEQLRLQRTGRPLADILRDLGAS